jgi:uncharacterized protein (DUF2141 family)
MKKLVLIALLFSSVFSFAQYSINVSVSGFLNSDGDVLVYLYKEGQKLKLEEAKFKTQKATIQDGQTNVVFNNIPKGKYAVLVLHDEDANGKLKMYFFGPPKEGIGASNNPKGHPKFEEASFTVDQNVVLDIEMNYLFR